MSNYNLQEIIKKYKAGSSTLEEEKMLFNNADERNSEFGLWTSFVKKNKKEIPENLNEKLWTSFEEKTKRKSNFKIGVLSAASIVLLLSVLIYNTNQNTLTESEKATLLEEAKNMFVNSNEEKEIYSKILENELIIVYAKSE